MLSYLIPFIYVLPGAVAAKKAQDNWEAAFGRPKDFTDFGSMIFICLCVGLLWPLVAVAYLVWILYRKEAVK